MKKATISIEGGSLVLRDRKTNKILYVGIAAGIKDYVKENNIEITNKNILL